MGSNSQSRLCPCCGGNSALTRHLSRTDIDSLLINAAILDSNTLKSISFGDYRMFRCCVCDLEFSDPMREPDNSFYKALARVEKYYPASRWEWSECIKQLRLQASSRRGQNIRVLDVGCGTGQFLSLLRGYDDFVGMGLEITEASVKVCRAQGLNVIHGDFSQAKIQIPEGVEAITLWHVLEHVSDPLGLLTNAKYLLRSGGRLFFSVPLSPTSYESSWTDPLNLPPHHLTRWNVKSITTLANRLDMTVDLIFPRIEGYFSRLLRVWLLQATGPFTKLKPAQKAVYLARWLISHPYKLIADGWRQLPKWHGGTLPDAVLVCLGRKE